MPRAAPALCALLATLMATGASLAQDPACKQPFERSQELRQEKKLVASRAELDACVQACPAELSEQCKIWIGEVEPQIGRLVIVAVDEQARALDAAQIELDGRALERAEWAGAIRVDPGPHVVVAKAGGAVGRSSITLAPGASERVTVTLHEKPAATVAAVPSSDEAPGKLSPLGLALVGGGVVGLLAGASMGLGGHVVAADYASRCRSADPACSQAGARAWRDQVSALWIGGGVAAGLGAGLLAAGVLYLTLHRAGPPHPEGGASRLGGSFDVELSARPGGIGLRVSF